MSGRCTCSKYDPQGLRQAGVHFHGCPALSVAIREVRVIDNRASSSGVLPGLGLFLEWCSGGVWRTAWVRLDEPVKEIKPQGGKT